MLVGCGSPKKNDISGHIISVVDFRGKTLRLDQPARRVVCLIESALSGIYMLGGQARVVGVPTAIYHENSAPQYAALDGRITRKELAAPGNWDFVNIESVLALKPDLVIIWASQKEAADNIERFGIPVYGVMLKCTTDVYKEIDDLGVMLDKKNRAEALVARTKQEIEAFGNNQSAERKKKIYFMWSQGLLHTSGTRSTVNEIIEAAGGVNACMSEKEHTVVNLENLLAWNPDIIVMWQNDRLDPEDILADSRLQTINAVRREQVFELPSVFFCDMWTLKFQYVIKMVARWSYPDRYSSIDLRQENKRMLRFLYGPQAGALLNE